MQMNKWGWMVVGLSAALVIGCSSDDGGGSGGAAATSCKTYCDKDAQANCGLYSSADECKSSECAGIEKTSGACGTALKAYYDCLAGLPDVCTTSGCEAQSEAMFSKCGGS